MEQSLDNLCVHITIRFVVWESNWSHVIKTGLDLCLWHATYIWLYWLDKNLFTIFLNEYIRAVAFN